MIHSLFFEQLSNPLVLYQRLLLIRTTAWFESESGCEKEKPVNS